MYAIVKIGGFQYRAEEGAVLQVPLQDAKEGDSLSLGDVMLIQKGNTPVVGSPFVDGAKIEAKVLGHGKADKVEIYKYKRRTKYRRRQGHRQDFTELKINKIVAP